MATVFICRFLCFFMECEEFLWGKYFHSLAQRHREMSEIAGKKTYYLTGKDHLQKRFIVCHLSSMIYPILHSYPTVSAKYALSHILRFTSPVVLLRAFADTRFKYRAMVSIDFSPSDSM